MIIVSGALIIEMGGGDVCVALCTWDALATVAHTQEVRALQEGLHRQISRTQDCIPCESDETSNEEGTECIPQSFFSSPEFLVLTTTSGYLTIIVPALAIAALVAIACNSMLLRSKERGSIQVAYARQFAPQPTGRL